MTYALARTVLDCDLVHEYVGQEPSGRNGLEFALDYKSKAVWWLISGTTYSTIFDSHVLDDFF